MSAVTAFLLGWILGVSVMTLVSVAVTELHYRREWREEELRLARRAGRDT